jgi:hypothetical protein
MICIPRHQECTGGRDGGQCGYCRRKAAQKVEHNEDLDLEAAQASMWSPKTEAASREIPFDASPRAEIVTERFFERFDRWPA